MDTRTIPLLADITTGLFVNQSGATPPGAPAGTPASSFVVPRDAFFGDIARVIGVGAAEPAFQAQPENGLVSASFVYVRYGVDGTQSQLISYDDAADGDPIYDTTDGLPAGTVSRLQAYDAGADAFDRVRALADDADDLPPLELGLLAVAARPQCFDGANYDRLRTASAANVAAQSGAGAQLVALPGDWSINHTPVANTQATITRAGAAGVRHVCTSIAATLNGLTTAVEATVLVNLRDGATGAGTILWSQRLHVIPGRTTQLQLSGLNIVGSAATAMTLEFAAAGGADSFESVALTGHDVS